MVPIIIIIIKKRSEYDFRLSLAHSQRVFDGECLRDFDRYIVCFFFHHLFCLFVIDAEREIRVTKNIRTTCWFLLIRDETPLKCIIFKCIFNRYERNLGTIFFFFWVMQDGKISKQGKLKTTIETFIRINADCVR